MSESRFDFTTVAKNAFVCGDLNDHGPLSLVIVVNKIGVDPYYASLSIKIADKKNRDLAVLGPIDIHAGCHLTIMDVMQAFNISVVNEDPDPRRSVETDEIDEIRNLIDRLARKRDRGLL